MKEKNLSEREMDDYVTDGELYMDFLSEMEAKAKLEIGECGDNEDYGDWEQRVEERTQDLIEAAERRANEERAEQLRWERQAQFW